MKGFGGSHLEDRVAELVVGEALCDGQRKRVGEGMGLMED